MATISSIKCIMTVRQMLKAYLFVLADVMPNVAGGKANVAHIVPLAFWLFFFYIYWWQVDQPLWQMLGQILMNQAGRYYVLVADEIATITKGDLILIFVMRY